MNDREKIGMDIERLRQMERTTCKEPPTEIKVPYKELTGKTFNNLMECQQALMAICEVLEAESSTPVQPEFKCFRDALTYNMDLSASLLDTINQIAQLIGV